MSGKGLKAVAYLRTSSKTNVGPDKDSDKRQLAAINRYARRAGYEIVDTFYDVAVSGADPVNERFAFAHMLERLLGNGVRTIIVESPDRFARDLIQQLLGHDLLKARGITLIAASSPQHFLEDTPTAVLIRQVLGGVAEFEKTTLVAKLKAARERKKAVTRGSRSERDHRHSVSTRGRLQGGAEVGSRSEDAMDLSTKLKITAVLAAVLMAVLWTVPVPV